MKRGELGRGWENFGWGWSCKGKAPAGSLDTWTLLADLSPSSWRATGLFPGSFLNSMKWGLQ